MVGPAGFEPATKGFTVTPMFPKGVDYLFTRAREKILALGGVRDALACYQGRSEIAPEVGPPVRAPPSGSLCTFQRCTAGLAQDCHAFPVQVRRKVSLNSSRPLRGFRARRHLLSMSPLH